MDALSLILVMLSGALLLIAGIAVGYWRGWNRATHNYEASHSLDALADVGQAILGAQLNLDALCEIVYQQSTRVIDTRDFQLGLIDGDDYEIKVWLKEAERLPTQIFKNGASEGLIGWVRDHARGLLINDFQKEWDSLPARPRYHDENNPARSAIFAPLIAGAKVIGVIAAQSQTPSTFTDEDLGRLTVLANQAAGAIRNAQLYTAAKERATRLRLIGEVSRQLSGVQPLPELQQQILRLVQGTFSYYAVNLFTIDTETNEIVLGASTAWDVGFKDIRLKMGFGIVGWVAENAEMAVVGDVSKDPRYVASAALPATKSELAAPLIFDNRVLGVLDVQSNEVDAFDKDDSFTLNALAQQLALAFQESITYSAERRQAERTNALIEAARAVVSILDISSLFDEVIDLITDHFGYDRVHIFLRDGDRVIFRGGKGSHTKRWLFENLAYNIEDKGFIPWVANHGQLIVSGNTAEDERYIKGGGLEDTQSEMTVPIQIGSRTLGVLDIQSPKTDAFSAEDVALVQALADTVAIALRNAGLIANEMRRRILSETLQEVSTVLASSLDLDSVLKEILLGLERVVEYTSAVILLLDDEKAYYLVSAIHGVTEDDAVWDEVLPADQDSEDHIDRILTMLAAKPSESSGEEPPKPRHEDTLSVPLSMGEEHIGHLAIKRIAAQSFSTEEKAITSTFASQAAVAIMNAQLYMAQKEEAWISTALLQVAEATGQATSPDEVLETVARITPLLAGVEWCAVFLSEDKFFRMVEVSGVNQRFVEAFQGFKIDPAQWPPMRDLIETGRPVILDATAPMPAGLPVEIDVVQAVLLPLFAKGTVIGTLLIGQREGDAPLTRRKIELVSGIANQAALAIEGAQLYTAQQEEQWITTVLLQVAEAVNSQFDLDSTLESIVRLTTLLVGVTRCIILRWNDSLQQFYASKSFGLSPQGERLFNQLMIRPAESQLFTTLWETLQAVPAGENLPYFIPDSLREAVEIPAVLALPLMAQGTIVGAMLVDHFEFESHSGQRRLNILIGIAYQSALAIRTARLQEEAIIAESFEREMEVARGIQLSLLPDKPPQIDGWDVAAYYRPARLVGGDFYDFIPLGDDKYAFVIADVADKGIAAAMFMTVCRTIIRAVASRRRSAAETLLRVNKLVVHDNRSELFFTCWYGILDVKTGTLQFSSGGHNPPLIAKENGELVELRIKGIALGLFDPIQLQEATVEIEVGDTLLAYTDGLTEAQRADNSEFGEVELHITTRKLRQRSAADFVQKLTTAVDRFTGDQPAFDDLTLFVVKRLTQSSVSPNGQPEQSTSELPYSGALVESDEEEGVNS
ncbi:MAG: GAF domain-containing protein [Chloroflexi bacterium]|nr:GAF domain-containing protein [Chloroflexota bacterium]NOG62310.1 GAF domain-containing protein [Chloroflexota bacterium]